MVLAEGKMMAQGLKNSAREKKIAKPLPHPNRFH
jgi:hypothetical protein